MVTRLIPLVLAAASVGLPHPPLTQQEDQNKPAALSFGPDEERIIREWFHNPILAEQLTREGQLPPSLQRRLGKGSVLPAGLQGRVHPLDENLEGRLPMTPSGIRRGRVGGNVILLEQSTFRILDIITDVASEQALILARVRALKAASGAKPATAAPQSALSRQGAPLAPTVTPVQQKPTRSPCPVERECIDVILPHLGAQQKVGPVNIELLAATPLRKMFTVNLYFDGKQTSRRDKAVNEPVYFYVQGQPSAMELVVTQVGEGSIAGYLSAPAGFRAPKVTPAEAIPTVTVLDLKLEPDRFKKGRIRVRGYFGNVLGAMGAFTLHEGNAYIYVRFDDLPPAEKRKMYTAQYGTRLVVTVKLEPTVLGGSNFVAESIQPE